MREIIVIALVLGLLVLFGCIGSEKQANGETLEMANSQHPYMESQQKINNSPAGGEVSGQQNVEGENQQDMEGGEKNQSNESSNAHESEEEQDLDALEFAELKALGVPIKCDIKVEDEGKNSNIVIYIKGDNMRVEATGLDEEVEGTFVEIIKNNEIYITGPQMFHDCDWIKINIGESSNQQNSSGEENYGGVDVDELEAMRGDANVVYHCVEANFGDEMFDTPGNVCDMNQPPVLPTN